MKPKKLEWRNIVVKAARDKGIIELIVNTPYNLVTYSIRNYIRVEYPKIREGKFFVVSSEAFNEYSYETDSLESAKEIAQKMYEKLLIETFFEI